MMSEVPTRIFVTEYGDCIPLPSGNGWGRPAHYIRADIHEALQAELKLVKAQRDELLSSFNSSLFSDIEAAIAACQQPLGADFEKVWDENTDRLYQK
jgi:hypothetical protein